MLDKLQNQLEVKSQELRGLISDESATVAQIEMLTGEIRGLKEQIQSYAEAEAALTPVNGAPIVERKSGYTLGDLRNSGTRGMDVKGEELDPFLKSIHRESVMSFAEYKTTVTTSNVNAPRIPTGILYSGSTPETAFLDWIPKLTLTSPNQSFQIFARTNNASTLAEGSAPSESALSATETVISSKPTIAFLPLSEAALASYDRDMMNYIREEVMYQAKVKVDTEIIQGSNLNSLSTLTGINTGAVSTGTGSASSIKLYRDSVESAKAQIKADGDTPVVLLVNPSDFALMISQKDTTFGYVLDPNYSGVPRFCGLEVIEDANLSSGTCYVLGSRGINLGILKGGFNFSIGLNSDDFSKGKQTLRAMVNANTIYRPKAIYKLSL